MREMIYIFDSSDDDDIDGKEAMIPLLVLMVLTLSQVKRVPMKYLVEREIIKFMEVTGMIN